MPDDPLPGPVLVVQPKQLSELANALERQPVVAVDTESNSLFAYREQVCLVQFSIPGVDYLVDPLALTDLSALAPFFANTHIEKIFHAAEYDLICLKRDFGFRFANLFDTMVAARILGRKEVGLGSLLEAEFGIQLDKKYQRADWGERPLPPQLLAYARLDTHYLIALRDRLEAELEEKNRQLLACEDFRRLCNINGRPNGENDEETCFRITGVFDLTPQQLAVLQELCRYRDQLARRMNRPLFKVIGNETLHAIAISIPSSQEELSRLPGMSKGQLRRHSTGLLQAVQRGLQAEPIVLARNPRPSEPYMSRLEALRQWRKKAAQKMEVESDIVLPRDLLYAIAETTPRRFADLEAVLHDTPWRLERFGGEILTALGVDHR